MHTGSESLLKQGYSLSETIKHQELNIFISNHKWKFSLLHIAYVSFSFMLLALTVYLIVFSLNSIISSLLYSTLGVLISFLLIPIHELIHCAALKSFGAKRVTILPNFSQYYYLTISHHFLVGKNEIGWISLLPFILVTGIGFILYYFTSSNWQIVIISAILFHTSICSTDFRIVDFFYSKEKEYKMYSDIEENETYLFSRTY